MPKQIERELKSIDSRFLYKPKKKMSSSTEPILLGATKTTELMEGIIGPAAITDNINDDNPVGDDSIANNDNPKPSNTSTAETDKQNKPIEDKSIKKNEEKFPRSSPYMGVPPSLLSNYDDTATAAAPAPSDDNKNDVGSENNSKNGGSQKQQKGSSVIVNLSPSGSSTSPDNSKRLSRILDEVKRMRELRERKNSFGTDGSFDDRMERTKEHILRRLDKMKQSKRLLFKYRIYEFLKRPSTFWSTIYHVVAFVLVFTCLIVSIAPQMDNQLEHWGGKWFILDLLEKIVVIWFSVEYLLRLWSCDCRSKYQGYQGIFNFIKAPAHLIDLFVIILSVLVMIWPHEGHEVFAFRAFRGFHRFFQVVQIIITERQLRPWRLFLSVLYDQREQLMIIFYLEIILFASLAYLGFVVEHQSNDMLDTMAEAVWWSVVTLTTVGYGDKVPISWRGKIISGAFILFGFCVFALPAGIIGAGLALKLEQVEQSRHRRRKLESAARLIQRAWHCYHDCHNFQQLSLLFNQQSDDLYRERILENISQAFISLCRFHVAKTEFKQLTRAVNLRNVIESYKYGQMDIFARLNAISTNMDKIMTKMAYIEQERIEAMKRLTQQLNPESGDALIRGRDGSYLINTVSGCFQKTDSSIPDLTYIPKDADFDRDSMRVRSFNHHQRDPIPYIDYDSATATTAANKDGEDSNKLRKRNSDADKRRHSK